MGTPNNSPADYIDWVAIRTNINEAFRKFSDSIKVVQGSPSFLEIRSRVRYREAIQRERAVGLGFVRAEATRVRRELGLPES